MPVSAARLCAFKILAGEKFSRIQVRDLIDKELDDRDARFAEKLVNGVRAYKICLDAAIKKSCRPGTKFTKNVKLALEISAYELLYLGKEPYIAVNEGVELVKHVKRGASGLANVVLKKVASSKISDFSKHLQYGFSDDVYQILVGELGESRALAFMHMSDIVPESEKVGNIYANASSVQIAESVARCLENTSSFLEVGAGRGTKTCLIQHFLSYEAKANLRYEILELSEEKIKDLQKRVEKNHLKIDKYNCGDATTYSMPDKFDVVFVDAPCSGLGTIRKHREIRWRLTPSDIENIHNLNVAILNNMSNYVEDGGLLIYSTCTIAYAENMGVIEEFLKSDAGSTYALESIIREPILTETSDAHFCVALRNSR